MTETSRPSSPDMHDGADAERPSKRIKRDSHETEESRKNLDLAVGMNALDENPRRTQVPLPPSRALLGPLTTAESDHHFNEIDVGISEYISSTVPPISGIIKQRFTDFLVYEVNQDSEVIRIKSLEMPTSERKKDQNLPGDVDALCDPEVIGTEKLPDGKDIQMEESNLQTPEEPKQDVHTEDRSWSDQMDERLTPFFTTDGLAALKALYLEGPQPPPVSDNGWASRRAQTSATDEGQIPAGAVGDVQDVTEKPSGARENRRGRGRDRGGRGRAKRGGVVDNRKVTSSPISSKDSRTQLHRAIRELFGGRLDSETDTTNPDDDAVIDIRWCHNASSNRGQGAERKRGADRDKAPRGTYPPYIHFTMQKTNRDTQDALSHLSRMLKVSIRDLSVAGTKDKRAVTTQRVSLKRNGKTVEDVWKMANGQYGRRTYEEAVSQRGERGVRVADFKYRKAGLELGMLKGNSFVITLRNVQVDSPAVMENSLLSMKNHGFINYYGMQRFGTASVPTHAVGLALLQSDWNKAVSLILQHRPGEHPDVAAAREAWLVEKDLDKALRLMPRRVVAERCVLESYKKQKGETRNALGALSTIPRNLRLMYIHAYQSYVWNAIVSERIRMHGAVKPVPGDIVLEENVSSRSGDIEISEGSSEVPPEGDIDVLDAEEQVDAPASDNHPSKRARKPWEPPRVKILSEEDIHKYNIFDVVMPLPGKDVAFPGGPLGEKYRQYLTMDGLDPNNFSRKQKDYSLSGSYRKIVHHPKDLSWSLLRYTDPDVPLAQADEDSLLGFDPPVVNEEGKFLALQIKITLGTAAYATMALREITKTDTSSHHQASLTQVSDDQLHRGGTGITDEGEEQVQLEA